MQARYYGPYTVDKRIIGVNYIVIIPGRRRQKHLCLINEFTVVNPVSSVSPELCEKDSEDMNSVNSDSNSSRLHYSDIPRNLDRELSYLEPVQRNELSDYEHLLTDISTRIDKIFDDVDIDGSKPVKQHPYRMNSHKQKYRKENCSTKIL